MEEKSLEGSGGVQSPLIKEGLKHIKFILHIVVPLGKGIRDISRSY